MPITKEELESTLKVTFPNAEIKAVDTAGDNDHWSVEIKDSAFAGKSRIEQHRMVQAAVASKNIHAMQIKTLAQ